MALHGANTHRHTAMINIPMTLDSERMIMRYAKVKWHSKPTSAVKMSSESAPCTSIIQLTDSSKDRQSEPQEVKFVEGEKVAIASRESRISIPRDKDSLDYFQSQGSVY